jgi:hypothetical protein
VALDHVQHHIVGAHIGSISVFRWALFTVPDDTVVWSGHGEQTTIGRERRTNPVSSNFVMWGFGDLVI